MNFISTPIHGLYILDSTLRSERQMPYDDVRGSFYIPRYMSFRAKRGI
jgi:hypothetical protein